MAEVRSGDARWRTLYTAQIPGPSSEISVTERLDARGVRAQVTRGHVQVRTHDVTSGKLTHSPHTMPAVLKCVEVQYTTGNCGNLWVEGGREGRRCKV